MTDDQNFNLELDEMNEMDFYEGKEDSDVDILVVLDNSTPVGLKFFGMYEDLKELLA